MPEHIVAALKVGSSLSWSTITAHGYIADKYQPPQQALGFDDFVGEVEDVLGEHKELAKASPPRRHHPSPARACPISLVERHADLAAFP